MEGFLICFNLPETHSIGGKKRCGNKDTTRGVNGHRSYHCLALLIILLLWQLHSLRRKALAPEQPTSIVAVSDIRRRTWTAHRRIDAALILTRAGRVPTTRGAVPDIKKETSRAVLPTIPKPSRSILTWLWPLQSRQGPTRPGRSGWQHRRLHHGTQNQPPPKFCT